MSTPYSDITPYLTSTGTVGTATNVRQFHGVYPAVVVSNSDPLNQNRITMYVPQFLGTAQSGWALPMVGILVAPQPGELVYAAFMGGDVSQPIYLNASQKQLNASALTTGTVPAITFAATAPANPANGDLWYNTANGNQLNQAQNGTFTPYQYGTEAISTSAITSKEIAAGALDAQSITAATITAGTVIAGAIQSTSSNPLTTPSSTSSGDTTVTGTQISMSSAGGQTPVGTSAGGSLLAYSTQASGSLTIVAPGAGQFTVPATVTSLKVQCTGGGGGGDQGSAGGGGGEYAAENNLAVTPGNQYNYFNAHGGAPSVNDNPAQDGGATFFTGDSVEVFANGGQGSQDTSLRGGLPGGDPSRRSSNTIAVSGGAGGFNTVFSGAGGNPHFDAGNWAGSGGGGAAGGATGAGGAGQNSSSTAGAAGGVPFTGSTGGAGGAGGQAFYGNNQGDYFASGSNGHAPGGGGGGGESGLYETFSNTGGSGANGQIIISWTPANTTQLIGSMAPSAGTDTAGNPYPAGFSGESFQLTNQLSAPFSNTGSSLLYGAGGRPWCQSPSGLGTAPNAGLPISCGYGQQASTSNSSNIGATISAPVTIPANDPNVGAMYKLMVHGTGTNTGAFSPGIVFEGFMGGSALSPVNINTPSGTMNFSWNVTVLCVVGALGSGPNNAVSDTTAVIGGGAGVLQLSTAASSTFTYITTVSQSYLVTAAISGGTITSLGTHFERLGQ